ncbi:MAG: hypothetical protein KGO49_11525 [Gammaproteobacteria bacterium]|nr:hypothetical protein [Gammaproteobacteria bacterium]
MKDPRLALRISALLACIILIPSILLISLLGAAFPSETITPRYEWILFDLSAIIITTAGFMFVGGLGEQIISSLTLRAICGTLLGIQILTFGLSPFLGGRHYEIIPFLYPFCILSILQFVFFVWPLHSKSTNTLPFP